MTSSVLSLNERNATSWRTFLYPPRGSIHPGLQSDLLKWVALVCMVISHVNTMIMVPLGHGDLVLDNIGRFAFPLFVATFVAHWGAAAASWVACKRLMIWAGIAQPFYWAAHGLVDDWVAPPWYEGNILFAFAFAAGIIRAIAIKNYALALGLLMLGSFICFESSYTAPGILVIVGAFGAAHAKNARVFAMSVVVFWSSLLLLRGPAITLDHAIIMGACIALIWFTGQISALTSVPMRLFHRGNLLVLYVVHLAAITVFVMLIGG